MNVKGTFNANHLILTEVAPPEFKEESALWRGYDMRRSCMLQAVIEVEPEKFVLWNLNLTTGPNSYQKARERAYEVSAADVETVLEMPGQEVPLPDTLDEAEEQ